MQQPVENKINGEKKNNTFLEFDLIYKNWIDKTVAINRNFKGIYFLFKDNLKNRHESRGSLEEVHIQFDLNSSFLL